MLGKTIKRVIAIIGLALIGVFTVVLPIYLAKPDIWEGRIGIIAMYTGIFGVLFFLIIWLDNKAVSRKRRLDELSAAARAEYEKNKAKSKDTAVTDTQDTEKAEMTNGRADSESVDHEEKER